MLLLCPVFIFGRFLSALCTYQNFCRHMQNINHVSHICVPRCWCVCTRLNVGLELKGHSPVCSLNQSGAGSLQGESGPHPPFPSPSSLPSFLSLLQLINPPSFPIFQVIQSAQTGIITMHLSSVIKNSSSLPPALDWIGSVQVRLGRGLTPHK